MPLFIIITLLSTGWAVHPAGAGEECRSLNLPWAKNLEGDCPPTFNIGALECDLLSCEWVVENGYWFGLSPEFNDTLVVALCPTNYCFVNKTGNSIRIPAADAISNSDSILCGQQHRTGIICGECVEGYAPAINSDTYECVRCDASDERVNWLYYILSVYVPLFILFLFIIIFNIKLTSGPANAFILYAQVVSTTFDLSANGQVPLNTIYPYIGRLLRVYRIPYNIFNLNFISNILPPFCLSRNFNSLDVIALNYVVAVFPLVMILLVILFYNCPCSQRINISSYVKYFKRHEWRLANSLIDAFAAFVLLSYTQFCLTSVYLIGLQPLWNERGDYVGRERLYLGGQFTSFDATYILRYGIPAYVVYGTFVAIPPILLLGFPIRWLEKLILKIEWLSARYPFDKVNILLDTFQGCFRNNRRFFAGMYFFFRIALYLTYMLTDTWQMQYTTQQVLVTMYIVLIAVLWPYKRNFINYVDIAIFANMGILNVLSIHLIDFNLLTPDAPLPLGAFVFQYILVFAPLFYMIAYVLWYLTKPCHKRIQVKSKHTLTRVVNTCLLRKKEQCLGVSDGPADVLPQEESMNGILQRAVERNTYKQNTDVRNICDDSFVMVSLAQDGTAPSSPLLEDEQNRFSAFYYEAENSV